MSIVIIILLVAAILMAVVAAYPHPTRPHLFPLAFAAYVLAELLRTVG